MGRVGHGVFEIASDLNPEWKEFEWMGALSRETGLPVTFAALQSLAKAIPLEKQIEEMEEQNAQGANIVAQLALRGNGVVMSWRSTLHPFVRHPSWTAIEELSWDEQYATLQDPAFKAKLLAEVSVPPDDPDLIPIFMVLTQAWSMQYQMDDGFNYEPQAEESIASRAEAAGVSGAEYIYDLMMQEDGTGFVYLPILNYLDGNLDFLEPLQQREDTVNSLSDGGAHCGTICDAASPTFMLEHWVRDRARGTITLENAIKRQCRDTARLYGLNDRGILKPGYLADINVIDLDNIKLGKPWLAFDLPAGGKRLLQKARGYDYTIKSGEVTFEQGVLADARPGGLIRGPQNVEDVKLAG
jgi:N-acyl-D-amino-acid deacylase